MNGDEGVADSEGMGVFSLQIEPVAPTLVNEGHTDLGFRRNDQS